MRLNGKFVADLTEMDMLQLVQDGRSEDQNLDFKRDAYGKSETDRKELVKDVRGFANASGGVILIGVTERDEAASEITGIARENARDPVERYERTIRDATEPMLSGIQIAAIPVGQHQKVVIAIGIPSSLARPHRAKTTSGGRWSIRRNRNTDDMTYSEIRSAFIDREGIDERVRRFHAQRITDVRNYIRENNKDENGGILLLHVVPLTANPLKLDVRAALPLRLHFFPPAQPGVASLKPDIDGIIASVNYRNMWGWVKLYRDGRTEGVMGNYVGLEGQEGDHGRRLLFSTRRFEHDVLLAVRGYVDGLVQLGFNPPFAVSISLLNGQGSSIDRTIPPPSEFLARTVTTLEPTIIEAYQPNSNYGPELRSVLDQLWNAFGIPCCPSFDEAGNWAGWQA